MQNISSIDYKNKLSEIQQRIPTVGENPDYFDLCLEADKLNEEYKNWEDNLANDPTTSTDYVKYNFLQAQSDYAKTRAEFLEFTRNLSPSVTATPSYQRYIDNFKHIDETMGTVNKGIDKYDNNFTLDITKYIQGKTETIQIMKNELSNL